MKLAPLILAVLLAAQLAAAAPPAAAAPQALAFKRVDTLGSDAQSIIAMLQDRQGFIWIGTIEGGLFRYDGRQAVRYQNDPLDPHSLPGGRIAALYSDEQGRIWAGTDEGLVRYDPASDGFVRYVPDSGPKNYRIVRRIISDGAGGMWLATWGGLQHFNPKTGRFLVHQHDPARPDSLAHNDINALAMDAQGGIWAGTWPGGLDYLAPGSSSFVHYRVDDPAAPSVKGNDVRALHADSAGKLWIGTDDGLVLWKAGTPWETRRRLPQQTGRVTHLDEDLGGDLWISTRTAGVWRWDRATDTFQVYQRRAEDSHSLSTNAINLTMHDRTGALWVGSFTDGVSRANLGYHGFERIVPRDVAPDVFKASNFVRSLGAAPDGKLWLGVDDGLVLFDPAARKLLRHYAADPKQPGTLSNNVVYSLYQQPGGPLWAGTSRGLNRLERPDGPFQAIHFGSGGIDFINRIAPGRGGVLWLGTSAGLVRYDTASGAHTVHAHDPRDSGSRSVDGVTTLMEDSAGRVWTGEFFRGGLDVRDPETGKFSRVRSDPANAATLSSDRITCLHEDAAGNIWVGTARGLNRIRFRDGKMEVRRFSAKGSLGKQMVEAIQSDRSGMLWVSTVAGLSKLEPVSESVTHYSVEDGLTEGFYLDASARGSDGRLYFGSTSGITSVNPAIHSSVSRPPQLAITGISLLNRPLRPGAMPAGVVLEGSVTAPQSLTLPWHADVLTLEFAALHYAEPRRNGYRYKLEGFDQYWVEADASRPVATYTNLNPGSYRLRIMGSNNKGLESKSEVVLPITITPPLWQTWWFRAALAAAVLALLAVLYRWRVRRLTARAAGLEAMVAERTRALQESNQKLAALSATDALTGIANRRGFDGALEREWRRAARRGEALAVAMFDVDHFKPYNDHYGHAAGDDCLRRVAQALAGGLHRAGDVVARYGGEEFAFIAPAASVEEALRMADSLRLAVEALALAHALSPFGRVTVSVGVAAAVPAQGSPAGGGTGLGATLGAAGAAADGAAALLHAADQALYRAKANGRNRAEAA
ncbi:ligand-binding sensor domain-containing diguanylate cyclase [Massilia sp. Root351]|jgi:diguanylate cyclase (GGDEF)-like protein|uniref:ligand-binding sensor domain-containing diguanylate cyclase n=1 Tax=Massilia sp. Root351 TaxID=1736522 RepID=UPI0009EBC704|nr:ligand-binding sensor domain-containing diguanylate cyclase [Massilia sp. Root351]